MRVDIVIATYNRPALLQEALQSVVGQSDPDWHCWIAEDGHSPLTARCLEPFLQDGRFHYLPGDHAGTPARPRNRAIAKGTAPLVAFLDDDDIWFPEKLQAQVDFLNAHPDVILLGANAVRWHPGEPWRRDQTPFFGKAPFGTVPYPQLVADNFFVTSGVMVRREALKQSGGFDETMIPPVGEDYSLWLRVGALGRMWLQKEPLLAYRLAAESEESHTAKQTRARTYQLRGRVFASALGQTGIAQTPLSRPDCQWQAQLCRRERAFYDKGPRVAGRARHKLAAWLTKWRKP